MACSISRGILRTVDRVTPFFMVNDPLLQIFTPDVIRTLHATTLTSEALKTRLAVLSADDHQPDHLGLWAR